MIIQGFGRAAASYEATKANTANTAMSGASRLFSPSQSDASTQLTISDQAKVLASSNDERKVQLAAKGFDTWTADDVDFMQKAGGFVNTMSKLSPSEKKLYDELVAQGNTEAASGMSLLALSRMGSGDVTLKNGQTFEPNNTAITPENIRNLFSQMFVDSDGASTKRFEALASYLDGKNAASDQTSERVAHQTA